MLVEVLGEKPMPTLPRVEAGREATVFFADDSAVARKEIVTVLDKLGVKYNRPTMAWKPGQADRHGQSRSSRSARR